MREQMVFSDTRVSTNKDEAFRAGCVALSFVTDLINETIVNKPDLTARRLGVATSYSFEAKWRSNRT